PTRSPPPTRRWPSCSANWTPPTPAGRNSRQAEPLPTSEPAQTPRPLGLSSSGCEPAQAEAPCSGTASARSQPACGSAQPRTGTAGRRSSEFATITGTLRRQLLSAQSRHTMFVAVLEHRLVGDVPVQLARGQG